MAFKIGDSVKVKEGIRCPEDDSIRLGGWQGRIFDLDELVGIRWDSITLKQLPVQYIRSSEKKGLDWSEIYLSLNEIELVKPRDSEDTADRVQEEMETLYSWLGMGKEGERIFNVISTAGDPLEGWTLHLTKTLKFPFDAVVGEPQQEGPLENGAKVQVQGIGDTDDTYGVLVDVMRGQNQYGFPLCDLTVQDTSSPNYLPVHDYCVWYANR